MEIKERNIEYVSCPGICRDKSRGSEVTTLTCSDGVNFPDVEWSTYWDERCGKMPPLFEVDKLYIVEIHGYGFIECVWDGDIFIPTLETDLVPCSEWVINSIKEAK